MLITFTTLAVVILVVVLILLYLKSYKDGAKSAATPVANRLPPGFPPDPERHDNMAEIAEAGSLTEFLIKLHDQFGEIASLWMKKMQVVSISSPELYKQVVHLFDRPHVLFDDLIPIIGKESTQFRNGPAGRQARKLHDRSFSHEKVIAQLPMFQQVVEEFCCKWMKLCESEEHIPLARDSYGLVLKSLARFAFGDYFKDEEALNSFSKDYDYAFWILETYVVNGPLTPGSEEEKALKEAIARLRETASKIIQQRQEAEIDPEKHVFIDSLFAHYDNEDALFSDVITYLIGGSHTTGYCVFWALYHLARHQDMQERCYKEICEFYSGGPITWDMLKNMKYLQNVISETERFTPLGPFAARCSDIEVTLGGYTLPPNTPIIVSLHTTLWDEKLWPDAQTFNPDRFGDRSQIPAYTFEPFGLGKRKCPGYRLVEVEAVVFLAFILKQFKISLAPNQPLAGYKFGLLTKPDKEVYVTIQKR